MMHMGYMDMAQVVVVGVIAYTHWNRRSKATMISRKHHRLGGHVTSSHCGTLDSDALPQPDY